VPINEGVSMSNVLPESRVVELWQGQIPGRVDLMTEEGEPIKVIYPGRLNDDRGADLRDAVITTSRGLMKGDIEVHVKSSGWWAHRHHQDPAYNRVILHVVFRHDVDKAINLQSGQTVPTLVLPKFLESRAERPADAAHQTTNWFMPCRDEIYRRDIDVMGRILDAAGEQRFHTKAGEFATTLAEMVPGQSLYRGIMGALGYNKNKYGMVELAHRLPLHRMESMAADNISDGEYLMRQQSLLMGTAGLLPSQRSERHGTYERHDGWVAGLERTWASSGGTAAMSEEDWHRFKVRPSNLPARRIAAMSYILLQFRAEGLLAGLVERVNREAADAGCGGLAGALRVTADGYWAQNLDFGLPARDTPALVGRGRADDIVVNVLLPFAAAWGQANSHQTLASQAFEIYRRHPVLAVNTLERHMTGQLGINRYIINSAQRQQGLIHIYRTRCSQGKCRECPVGN